MMLVSGMVFIVAMGRDFERWLSLVIRGDYQHNMGWASRALEFEECWCCKY